jgi:hypothetical protein
MKLRVLKSDTKASTLCWISKSVFPHRRPNSCRCSRVV